MMMIIMKIRSKDIETRLHKDEEDGEAAHNNIQYYYTLCCLPCAPICTRDNEATT